MNNDDTISREAALEALAFGTVGDYDILHVYEAKDRIEALTSVQPQVVHGRWKTINGKGCFTGGGNPLWGCSKCRHIIGAMLLPPKYNYCPNCGAKMDGGEDDG